MFIDINTTKNKYDILYIDPPWKYGNKNTGGKLKSGSANKYNVMEIADIEKLPICKLSKDNSVMFMWTTNNFMREAFYLLDKWGFDYKTSIYWNKDIFGMGFWFRNQIEICLFGIKGKVKPFRSSIRNYILERSRGHSIKPTRMYEIIESLGLDNKLELFARNKREGWDYWGDEIA